MKFYQEDIFVVTGASSGIGQGIAIKLNELGASVIAIGRDTNGLSATKLFCQNRDIVFLEEKDLTDDIEGLPLYVKELGEKYGKLRGLVCCAGVDCPKPLKAIELLSARMIFDINYYVPLFLAKGFLDKRNNIGEGASLVFIASSASVYPERGQAIYAGSKAALVASAKSMSKEVSMRKIRINCVSPAYVDTPMYRKNLENIGADLSNYALGVGHPSDVANMVSFLMSNQARWITGQNYILDGGAF